MGGKRESGGREGEEKRREGEEERGEERRERIGRVEREKRMLGGKAERESENDATPFGREVVKRGIVLEVFCQTIQ